MYGMVSYAHDTLRYAYGTCPADGFAGLRFFFKKREPSALLSAFFVSMALARRVMECRDRVKKRMTG